MASAVPRSPSSCFLYQSREAEIIVNVIDGDSGVFPVNPHFAGDLRVLPHDRCGVGQKPGGYMAAALFDLLFLGNRHRPTSRRPPRSDCLSSSPEGTTSSGPSSVRPDMVSSAPPRIGSVRVAISFPVFPWASSSFCLLALCHHSTFS